jgi:hypothetical protein
MGRRQLTPNGLLLLANPPAVFFLEPSFLRDNALLSGAATALHVTVLLAKPIMVARNGTVYVGSGGG